MLATGTFRSSTFLSQGRGRITVAILCVVILALVVFGHHIPHSEAYLDKINKRTEAAYNALFTFLTVFWAAILTIWSLLKSRATRYVERLADNLIFLEFMRDLEIRIVIGMAVAILSFVIYIVNPAIALPADNSTYLIAAWLILYGSSLVLLVDSLLTARVVL